MSLFYKRTAGLALCTLFSATSLYAQQSITGIVSDANGPISGVTVTVKGTTKGTQTIANGSFTIQAAQGETLRISIVGYKTQEIVVGSNKAINVTLTSDAAALDEVVVTAMGIKRESKALGYAVSNIKADEITKAGNTNFGSALYGKAPGVKITTAPGGSASAVNVQIRGINSLNYQRQPLYVVDGIIIRNDQQNGAAGANNNNFDRDQRIRGNGMLDINPADIDNISILKGAAASALYGSDAASGVIVITTKKGTKGRGLGVDFNYTGSLERAAFLPKFQNEYGPGYDAGINVTNGATAEGWILDPKSPSGRRPYFRSYASFGPKFTGEDVLWWDGQLSNRLSTDIVANYINTNTHNRTYLLGQVLGSFDGFFSRTEDMAAMKKAYQTSDGYKYSKLGTGRPEDFIYTMRASNLLDYF
uniref:TonB-dependent receptor plug domain-containing protein n=1 Tax=Panagrolaimus sp. ES5 TaxID=591445 RepID=A0AC34GA45_9BILA